MDIVDLKVIIANRDDDPDTYDVWSRAVMEDLGDTLEWLASNEPMMIPDYDFVEYAQGLADDLGLTNLSDPWPLSFIDWKAAAKELKHDYSSVTVDGVLYWFRSY